MDRTIFLKKAKEAELFCKNHNLIKWKDQKEYRFFPETIMSLNINNMEMYLNEHPDLEHIIMDNGEQTVKEWLETQPKEWRTTEIKAIYECLKRGWILNTMTIQSTAREADRI